MHSNKCDDIPSGLQIPTPNSCGLQIRTNKCSPCGVLFYIGVRGKSRAPLLMRLLFGFPDDKLFKGAYSKVPKGRETTDGGITPGNVATTEKAPRGRQNYNWFVDSILRTLSPRRGFFCCRTTTGGYTPVCGLSHLRCFSPDTNSCFTLRGA